MDLLDRVLKFMESAECNKQLQLGIDMHKDEHTGLLIYTGMPICKCTCVRTYSFFMQKQTSTYIIAIYTIHIYI